MIESKFSFSILVPCGVSSIWILFITAIIRSKESAFNPHLPTIVPFCFFAFVAFILWMLIMGELRTKTIKIWIKDDSIIKKGFLGFGRKKIINLNEIDGYKISFVPSQTGTYEYLYLINGTQKTLVTSAFYHRNYIELKEELTNIGLKFLGLEQWSFFREIDGVF